MGSSGGGKGGGGTDYNMAAGTNAYNAASRGASLESIIATGPEYTDAMTQGYNKWADEQAYNMMMMQMLEGMAGAGEEQQEAYASQLASQQEAQAAAAEEARIGQLTSSRDNLITGYFNAANAATSYVTEKISGEKANAAVMGVDYSMNDGLKGERIANYFSSIWSEGDQQALDTSFGEIGSGGFQQSVYRGSGVEEGPKGEVGEEKSGGGITPKAVKNTLIDDSDALGTAAILGA